MNLLRKEARNLAEAVLDAANINNPPILFAPLIKWVEENLGFELTIMHSDDYLNDNGLSGKYLRRRNRAFILINKNEPLVRQRFTLAHEFGHIFEALETAHMSQIMPLGYDKERFSDIFAAELLMPANIVKNEWSKLENGEPVIIQYKLAKIFNVSNEAMGYRLNELNLQSKQWLGTKIPPVYK